MFVIDANKWNVWHWYDSVSWQYDVPMWWECYIMFDVWKTEQNYLVRNTAAYYFCCSDLNIPCSNCSFFNWGWSWEDNQYSVIDWAKVYTIDWDIIYPFYTIWNFGWNGTSSFVSNWLCTYISSNYLCACFSCTDIWNKVLSPNWYDLSNKIIYNITSRKKFKWWELVWREIDWLIYYQYMNCRYYGSGNNKGWLKCPISIDMSIWLLHTDGTKSDIIKKTITTQCYCNCSSMPEYPTATYWEWNYWMFLDWLCCTNWLIACEWDRLIYDVRYSNWTKYSPYLYIGCSSLCANMYNMWSTRFVFCSTLMPPFFHKCLDSYEKNYWDYYKQWQCETCFNCFVWNYWRVYNYTTDERCRNHWISVSIE